MTSTHKLASTRSGVEANLYVVATRGAGNKELYLACDESECADGRPRMKWTDKIEDAYATFDYHETEDFAKSWFKKYNKWYIKKYIGLF